MQIFPAQFWDFCCAVRNYLLCFHDADTIMSAPIRIVEGDQPPKIEGDESHWIRGTEVRKFHPGLHTRNGNEWSFVSSTRRAEVGVGWFLQHATEREILRFLMLRIK